MSRCKILAWQAMLISERRRQMHAERGPEAEMSFARFKFDGLIHHNKENSS
jgi:hypothetical protein